MHAAGVCAISVTSMYFVPSSCKVNRWFLINYILKPVVETDISRLYLKCQIRIVPHFDSAGSHTTKEVFNWLDEREIKYIRKRNCWATRRIDENEAPGLLKLSITDLL